MGLYIFDMGNVVITKISFLEKIADELGLDRSSFSQDYHRYCYPLLEGNISHQAYWRHVEHRWRVKVEGDPFEEQFNPVPNRPVIDKIADLRASGERVVCGSNVFDSHWEKLRRQGYFTLFDALYASHEMHLGKPDPEFYTHILEREGYGPGETKFIDDREENTKAADALGITSLLYDYRSAEANEKLASF